MMPAAPPEAPEIPTSGHGVPPAVTRRRSHVGGAIGLIGLVVVLVAIIAGYVINQQQNQEIDATAAGTSALTSALNQQNAIIGQVCQIAGGQVAGNTQAAEACERVAKGQPAVAPPSPVVVSGQPGANGIGIDHVEQDGQCYINVILTNHSTSRFGSFCGADGTPGATGPTGVAGVTGQTGPTGAPGVNGQDGQNGATGPAGVGISSIADSADGCYVTVTLTDGTTQTVGPFCGAPAANITMTLSDGSIQDCARSGGTDDQPDYSCSAPPPATTTGAPPT